MANSTANYSGRQSNNTSYIKNFYYGQSSQLWKVQNYTNVSGTIVKTLAPSSINIPNLYIPGDIYLDGSIITPSDSYLKENINLINEETTNKLLNLKVNSFSYKDDIEKKIHYGFVAQEFENEYKELVTIKPDSNYKNLKAINYLEIVPLLVNKIQMMQKEIDELKSKIDITL